MLVRAVIGLMMGILVVVKPDALKRRSAKFQLNPELTPTKSYIRLMRGTGIAVIVIAVFVILKELKIL